MESKRAMPDIESFSRDAAVLSQALPYMQRYEGKTVVVKYGGHAMGDIALGKAFAELTKLGVNQRALVFTESRRTQDYLFGLLEQGPYAGQTVLFNGSNASEQAQRIHAAWLQCHAGTDLITGSRTADTRAALVEHFKEQAQWAAL